MDIMLDSISPSRKNQYQYFKLSCKVEEGRTPPNFYQQRQYYLDTKLEIQKKKGKKIVGSSL